MSPTKQKAGGWVDPLHRPVAASSVTSQGVDVEIEPTAAERAALAEALDLAAVDRLKAKFRLTPRAGGAIAVIGEIDALTRPVCVVSLEPFELPIREKVDLRFTDRGEREADGDIDYSSADDPPDAIENGVIDLGKVVTEFLSLALPAFPRKEDAVFQGGGGDSSESPFAALATIKPAKS